jgi:hypothetical protein
MSEAGKRAGPSIPVDESGDRRGDLAASEPCVTPEMISAGVAVLDELEGEVSRATLAELVFQAMLGVSRGSSAK